MHAHHDRPRNVFYHQGCPVCGRTLEVNVSLLGRLVYCQHCGGGFIAMDASMGRGLPSPRPSTVDKAEELLERAAMMLGRTADVR
jgi:hypothetical protein